MRGGNTSVFQVGAQHLFPEFCCHSGRCSAAQVLEQECVCVRGVGGGDTPVLYGQDEYVTAFVRAAIAQPAVTTVHRNCQHPLVIHFCLVLLYQISFLLLAPGTNY